VEERGKRGAGGWRLLSRSGGERRRGRSEPGEGAARGRGKLTGGTRPSAAPGGRKGGVAAVREAGLGRLARAGLRAEKERERGKEKGCSWAGCVGRWPTGVLEGGFFGFEFDWPLSNSNPHHLNQTNSKIQLN
jgi:hypothetical protein